MHLRSLVIALTVGAVFAIGSVAVAREPVAPEAQAVAPAVTETPQPGPAVAPPFETVVRQLSWKTLHTNLYLDVARKGKEPSRKMMEVYLRQTDAGQDMFMTFKEPSNMKGMTFLAHNNLDKSDDWYIYVRTLRRVKRVPSAAENFMLRDFLSLYLLKPRTELWNYQAGDMVSATNGSGQWYTYIGTPRSDETVSLTGYGKLVQYVDPKTNLIMKTEFYDKDLKLIRIQTVEKVEQRNGAWVPAQFFTDDLEEGVTATATLFDLDTNIEVSPTIFTVRYIKNM